MATVAGVQTVAITIDGVDLEVPKGELIVESAKRLGIEIPIFCYHPRMKPVGMCRMCLVEVGTKQPDGTVRMMPKPQAGCTLPASDGLVIKTDTEAIHKDRKGVLEFLLINHPLDCPICDRGGECPLQNNTLFYGPSTSRFIEPKRHASKAFPLSDHVVLDLERCIQCGRCVRFTEEISGDSQLAFRFRGAQMQPSTFEMRKFASKFSGNTIEICPVGALTSANYRFRARPWDLETKPGICTNCSNGCNVWFDHRVGKFVRMNGRVNEAVNEEWTCDKGKFGQEFYHSGDRLSSALVRRSDELIPTPFDEAMLATTEALKAARSKIAILVGPTASLEDMAMLQRFATESAKSELISADWSTGGVTFPTSTAVTPIADLESAKTILVFGKDLSDELPIVFLRVRKGWFKNGAKVIVASENGTDADSFADQVLHFSPGTGATLLEALAGLTSAEQAASTCGIAVDKIQAAAALLVEGQTALVSARTSFAGEAGTKAISALSALGTKLGVPANFYATRGNEQGAIELGLTQKSVTDLLNACVAGSVDTLVVAGCDPFTEYADRDLVSKALEKVEKLIVLGTTVNESVHYASIVLPQTGPAEQDGTYINCERRVQRMKPILKAPGDSRPIWKVIQDVQLRISPMRALFDSSDVMDWIGATHAAFQAASYDKLGDSGVLLGGQG